MTRDTTHLYPDRLLRPDEKREKEKRKQEAKDAKYERDALKRAKEPKPPDEQWVKARRRGPGHYKDWLIFLLREWEAMTPDQRQRYEVMRTDDTGNHYQLRDGAPKARRGTVRYSSLTPPRRF